MFSVVNFICGFDTAEEVVIMMISAAHESIHVRMWTATEIQCWIVMLNNTDVREGDVLLDAALSPRGMTAISRRRGTFKYVMILLYSIMSAQGIIVLKTWVNRVNLFNISCTRLVIYSHERALLISLRFKRY